MTLEIPKDCILKFTAKWCGPCRRIEPLFASFEEEYPAIKVIVVDSDEHPDICDLYNCNSLPTILDISGGEVVQICKGAKETEIRKIFAKKNQILQKMPINEEAEIHVDRTH